MYLRQVLDTVPTGILLTRLARSLVIIMANIEQASDSEAPVSIQVRYVDPRHHLACR